MHLFQNMCLVFFAISHVFFSGMLYESKWKGKFLDYMAYCSANVRMVSKFFTVSGEKVKFAPYYTRILYTSRYDSIFQGPER